MTCYDRLEPFAENRGILEELKRRGVRAGILSNGDPDMLEAVVGNAGFAALLDPVLSVEGTGRFKTDPATYALGTAALGLTAADVLFVSSNCWDAIGATWFGYTTLWINRFGLPLDELGAAPTRTGTNLADVLAFSFASSRNLAP
jgi:2-haloacid dehalogenase